MRARSARKRAHCARKGQAQWPKSMLERASVTWTRPTRRRYARTEFALAARSTVRGVPDSHSFWCNHNVLETIIVTDVADCSDINTFTLLIYNWRYLLSRQFQTESIKNWNYVCNLIRIKDLFCLKIKYLHVLDVELYLVLIRITWTLSYVTRC